MLYSYFCIPKLRSLPLNELIDLDSMIDIVKPEEINQDYLFLIRMTPTPDIDYYFLAKREHIEIIRAKPVGINLSAVYSFDAAPGPLLFYQVNVSSEDGGKTFHSRIRRLGVKAKILTGKLLRGYLKSGIFDKDRVKKDPNYVTRSMNGHNNERLGRLGRDMMRLFIVKTKTNLKKMSFVFMINYSPKGELISLLDTKNIDPVIFDHDALLETAMLERNKKMMKKPKACKGIYCNYRDIYEKSPIDEKDELNNLYLMETSPNERLEIDHKSIVLDLVERIKTIERVHYSTGINKSDVVNLPPGLLLKFRKFYSIADLKEYNLLGHIQYIHLYHKHKVCPLCYAVYNKMDSFRVESRNKKNQYLKDASLILEKIKEYLFDRDRNYNNFDRMMRRAWSKSSKKEDNYPFKSMDRKKFSRKFFEKLKDFDHLVEEDELYDFDQGVLTKKESKLLGKIDRRRKVIKMNRNQQTGIDILKLASFHLQSKFGSGAGSLNAGTVIGGLLGNLGIAKQQKRQSFGLPSIDGFANKNRSKFCSFLAFSLFYVFFPECFYVFLFIREF